MAAVTAAIVGAAAVGIGGAEELFAVSSNLVMSSY